MKIRRSSLIVLLATFSAVSCISTPTNKSGFDCSKKAFRALQEEVDRAEREAKPFYVAEELDPTESNTAAAANAATLVTIAEANLAVSEAACRADL